MANICSGIIRLSKVIRFTVAVALLAEGMCPSDFMKEGEAMVSYSDLIQFSILIVAIISLVYKITHKK